MKKIIAALLFACLFTAAVFRANEIVVDKKANRYYMLEQELEQRDEAYEVEAFGSCHAYTSFDPLYFQELTGLYGYNMANPSEIIPTTYLRMLKQFKKSAPKVAFVEIWGTNAYDTYIETDVLFGKYLTVNIERLPLTKEKLEVIRDFDALDVVNDNFALARYKTRILSSSLTSIDFHYTFEECNALYGKDDRYAWIYREMENRFSHNGFWEIAGKALDDYDEMQAKIPEGACLEVEPVLLKYVRKIVELCEQYEVTLVFYRSPYISKETELQKCNYLAKYLAENRIPFYDLEKEIDFDPMTDFNDYQHLSKTGAKKATQFLAEVYTELINGSKCE